MSTLRATVVLTWTVVDIVKIFAHFRSIRQEREGFLFESVNHTSKKWLSCGPAGFLFHHTVVIRESKVPPCPGHSHISPKERSRWSKRKGCSDIHSWKKNPFAVLSLAALHDIHDFLKIEAFVPGSNVILYCMFTNCMYFTCSTCSNTVSSKVFMIAS